MPSAVPHDGSLRERKRRRAREAIVGAAVELFTERGFDDVTVTDIAERAEVGRTTFFRYFGDKQEVLFRGDEEMIAAIAEAVGAPETPLKDSLPAAMNYVRALVVTFVERLTEDVAGYTLHERLVAGHPELYARSVVKQRRYTARLADRLTAYGADPATATLAAEIGIACYYAGKRIAGDDPRRLPKAVTAAFDRLDAPRPRPLFAVP